MKKLNFFPVSNIEELAHPAESQDVSLETPALEFFTDFQRTNPLLIDSSVLAVDIKKLMIKAHVRLKIVVNDKYQFVGVISADDLIDRKMVQKVSEGFKREELLVTDLMQRKKDLVALDISEVEGASIADVIEVLKDSGKQHCLVVDRDALMIRGIFSASDISRKLQLPIDIQGQSSFYKIFTAMN